MRHYLLIVFSFLEALLRNSVNAARLRSVGITHSASDPVNMAVIGCRSGCRHFLRSHVGTGSISYDFLES